MAEQSSPGIKAWQVVVSLVGATAVVYLIGALFNWYWPWWAYALMFALCMVTTLGRMISDTEKPRGAPGGDGDEVDLLATALIPLPLMGVALT